MLLRKQGSLQPEAPFAIGLRLSAVAARELLEDDHLAMFRDWLAATYPDRAARVMGRVRELHGGRDYDPEFGKRMTGQGLWADLIHRRADLARKRLGLGEGLPGLRTDLFAPPPKPGDQLTLF